MKKSSFLFLFLTSVTMVFAQPFSPVKAVPESGTIVLPQGLTYSVLFSEGDTVLNQRNERSPAKGSHDYNAFLSEGSSDKGLLYIGHEANKANDYLGDGGGATIVTVERSGDQWKAIGDKHNVDFSKV